MAELDSSKTPIIKVGTTEAVRNVKDLRDNIKNLRDEIVALSNAEEKNSDTDRALADAESKLIQSQQELNRVMGLTKRGADGVEGSYNNLKAQLRETKTAMDALPRLINGQLNPAWDALAERYRTLNAEAKAYDFQLGNFQRNVGNYGNAWESLGNTMNTVKQVGGDMANGLTAAASTIAMIGISTDGLNESMQNFRIVLAAVQGVKGLAGMVKGLKDSIKFGRQAATTTNTETAATRAHAGAMAADATATGAATVATKLFRAALIATGIGAIVVGIGTLVAHLEDVAKWFGKVAEKIGIAKRDTDKYKDANEKLTREFEDQNDALELKEKIQRAEGRTNRQLLLQRLELIDAQIAETEATIEGIKARQQQIKNDSAWVRFWKGENAEFKKLDKQLEGLAETLENLEKSRTKIKVDIQVDEIETGNTAADKRKEDLEKAKKLAEDVMNKGVAEANKQLEKRETELQKINRTNKETAKLIDSAVTATEKLISEQEVLVEQQQKIVDGKKEASKEDKNKLTTLKNELVVMRQNLKVLQEGADAAKLNLEDELADYWRKEYMKYYADEEQKIANATKQKYEQEIQYQKLMRDVLGMDVLRARNLGKAAAEQMRQYEALKNSLDLLKRDIGLPDTKQLVKETVDGVEVMVEKSLFEVYKFFTPEQLRKEVGEPTATALLEYFKQAEEIEDVGFAMVENIFKNYEEAINQQLSQGNIKAGALLANRFRDQFYEQFRSMGLGEEILEYFDKVIDRGVAQVQSESELPGFSFIDTLFPESDIAKAKERIEQLKGFMESLRDNTLMTQLQIEFTTIRIEKEIAAEEEKIRNARLNRWNAFYGTLGKYANSYGKATANALSSVADLWEESLNSQENTNEKAFNGVKLLQSATAGINAAAAVVQALADPTVPSYYVKVANAAAAAAAGIAQIIKINNTKYGKEASTGSAPTLVDRTPQLQYTYALNTADYAAAMAQNPVRAFIVDKDLMNGIDNYNARENETTF